MSFLKDFFKRHDVAPAGAYSSDITQFINQLHAKDPGLAERQRAGRALLWDKKPIDLDERASQQASRVEQSGYVYYSNDDGLPEGQ
jgi:hypothetical protein